MTPNGFPEPPKIDWLMMAPTTIVIVVGIVALLLEMFRPRKSNGAIIWASLIGLAVAGWYTLVQLPLPEGETFAQMIVRDKLAIVLQLLLIGVAFVSIMFSEGYLREKRIPYGEFYPLVLWATTGGMIMVATKSLLMLFIGLEILSIALYVLAGLSRKEAKSEESAIKYFLLGAFASAFLLYGIAFVYGASGGVHLDGIATAWKAGDPAIHNLLLFGLGLLLIGLCFKSAFVPFHQWTPDVYQGAPTNVTAFMAAGSKVAAIGALYRVLDASGTMMEFWMPVLFWIAILTMTVGNLVACTQRDVKRTLGYSSIANAGYILVALLAHFKDPEKVGIQATVFYLVAYSFMTLGTFAVVSLTAQAGKEGTRFADLNGLYHRSPLSAGLLVLFVASLIGVPPTAGFFGKYFIFADALQAGLVPLAIVLALNSAISVYYYLGIIRAAFVADEPAARPLGTGKVTAGLTLATVACAAGVLGISFFSAPILDAVAPEKKAVSTETVDTVPVLNVDSATPN